MARSAALPPPLRAAQILRHPEPEPPALSAIEFIVNGAPRTVDVAPDTPLLWVLRDNLGLTGTKFGCGIALCGSCTVHIDGNKG